MNAQKQEKKEVIKDTPVKNEKKKKKNDNVICGPTQVSINLIVSCVLFIILLSTAM